MGKEELNNIKKMYLLRMHTNKKICNNSILCCHCICISRYIVNGYKFFNRQRCILSES